MCGIMAYLSGRPQKEHVDIVRRIAGELATRGTHCFGVSFIISGKIVTVKRRTMLPSSVFEEAVMSGGFVFHNRYSTSGDFSDMKNNQPIDIGCVSIAVNGVTSMLEKKEYEQKFGVSCSSDNDAEIIARLIESGVTIEELLVRRDIGSCAIAAIFQDKRIIVGRNEFRPLRIARHYGAVFVSSTTASLFNGLRENCGNPVPIGKELELTSYG